MSTRRKHIFILIDALGWRFLESRNFLGAVLPHRRPLKTVLGFSSGAIPTILTGLSPARTGHWNLFYYDPLGSPFRWLRHAAFLPNTLLDHPVSRRLLRELGRKVLRLGPLFECCVKPSLLHAFNWVEKRNIYEKDGIPGSSSIFDLLEAKHINYKSYSYHHFTDEQILKKARRDLRNSQPDFLFLYLSELDSLLHADPLGSEEIDERLDWYGEHIRVLFDSATRMNPHTMCIVFSDHGMAPVHQRIDLVNTVDGCGFSMPHDYLAVYDSTMARFWFFSERAKSEITNLLAKLPCGRVLTDSGLRELGIFFPDRRYGEIVFLLNPGWLISKSDFNGAGWNPRGMHGYHPDDPNSDGIFLSSEAPSFDVRTIADVYRCMEEAITDESPANLCPALL
jgi:predicted AlkP superfamily pyrophosphatase or phosphodiesterase